MAKMADDASKETFRDLARRDYEERRADARLTPAQRTCMTLDERAGITVSLDPFHSLRNAVNDVGLCGPPQFNVLWLNPNEMDTIPKGLTDALLEYTQGAFPVPSGGSNEATRLRDQMRADALQPVTSDDDENTFINNREMNKAPRREDFPVDTVEEAIYFFRLGVRPPCFCPVSCSGLTLGNVASRSAESRLGVSARQACILLLVWDRVRG